MSTEIFIGLISGTSRDGLDAVLIDFEDGHPDLLHASCTPYPQGIRDQLDALLDKAVRPEAHDVYSLDRQLGDFFARVCRRLMEESSLKPRDIRAIGSHGQTVWHEPGGDRPVSMQLGSGPAIARLTGVTAVTDFRAADIAAGGQGAPLAPLLHCELFLDDRENRAVLNLGGIANLTILEPGKAVSGFDSGPANCLMDQWIQAHSGDEFDRDGAWAASGGLNEDLLARLLEEPYFELPPPKSTGLETFNPGWLKPRLQGLELSPEDVQRTLAELTVRTIVDCLQGYSTERLLICGGGVHNGFLIERLRDKAQNVEIESTAEHGVHPDWVEASLFAWLARERLLGMELDTRTITGADQAVMLGEIHEP